jgi:hypothetical protein
MDYDYDCDCDCDCDYFSVCWSKLPVLPPLHISEVSGPNLFLTTD